MRPLRTATLVFAAALFLSAAALLSQPASFERLDDLVARDQVAAAVSELTGLAAQSWPGLPALDPSKEEILRRAIETGRRHLGTAAADADDRRASRWLVCLARAYFPDEAPDPAINPKGAAEPLRVTGGVRRPEILSKINPRYTPEAREKKVRGTVIVEAIIDTEGCVRNARVLKGLPEGLDEATLAAVRDWVFQPATLNGEPVKVYYVMTANYRGEEEGKQ